MKNEIKNRKRDREDEVLAKKRQRNAKRFVGKMLETRQQLIDDGIMENPIPCMIIDKAMFWFKDEFTKKSSDPFFAEEKKYLTKRYIVEELYRQNWDYEDVVTA